MMAFQLSGYTCQSGAVEKYAWPGGYPLYYLCSDGAALCPDCVDSNREEIDAAIDEQSPNGWLVVSADINWENTELTCDHCGEPIESAYGDKTT